MSEPDRPAAAAPGNPTPEEISARLEALLKRTHALRAEQQADAAKPMTWPPPARELEHIDVVGVPEQSSLPRVEVPAAPAPDPAPADQAPATAAPDRPAFSFEEPAPAPRRWLPALTFVLALTTLGQAAYLFYLHQHGRLLPIFGTDAVAMSDAPRDQGPEQRATATAPTSTPEVPVVESGPEAAASPAPPAPEVSPAAASATGLAGVSPTRGAVVIDSTPTGLPVVMEGHERGVTPITIGELRPGRHDVMVGGRLFKVDIAAQSVATLHVQ